MFVWMEASLQASSEANCYILNEWIRMVFGPDVERGTNEERLITFIQRFLSVEEAERGMGILHRVHGPEASSKLRSAYIRQMTIQNG